MPSMKAFPMSLYMQHWQAHAEKAESKGRHQFGMEDIGSREKPSPKLAKSGLFYLECRRCKRCVFHNGAGTALEVRCEL